MWSSIVQGIVSLFQSIINIFQKKAEVKEKAVEKANTEEEKKKEQVIQDVKFKDETEELVKKAQEGDKDAIEKLRTIISS